MTVKRRLNKQNLYKLKSLIRPLLSENHRESRLNQANKNINQSIVFFTNKTTFLQFSKPKKVWRQKGEIIKILIVKYFEKVHIYSYFFEKEFENIYYFTENLTNNLLYIIYKNIYYLLLNFFGEDNYN